MKIPAPIRIMCHGRPTLKIALRYGWLPGARYTNLRDIVGFDVVGLIDIEWKTYDFKKHLEAVKSVRPLLTIARDVEKKSQLRRVLDQAYELSRWAHKVVIVPKDTGLKSFLSEAIPKQFILGYSVPTRYGCTDIPLNYFLGRPAHLLGGRPDVQFKLAQVLKVYSMDGNRLTLDASYGDYFNGITFRPHPKGGYYQCIRASLKAVNRLWLRNDLRVSQSRLPMRTPMT